MENNTNEEEEEKNSLEKFQSLIKEWETDPNSHNYDPTHHLEQMAEILEKETHIYMASDRDPFEERHPCRVDAESQLGMILKAYFKKETLVNDVFDKYTRDNYFTRLYNIYYRCGLLSRDKSSGDVVLLIDIRA